MTITYQAVLEFIDVQAII